jgi:hypothetical protein
MDVTTAEGIALGIFVVITIAFGIWVAYLAMMK